MIIPGIRPPAPARPLHHSQILAQPRVRVTARTSCKRDLASISTREREREFLRGGRADTPLFLIKRQNLFSTQRWPAPDI